MSSRRARRPSVKRRRRSGPADHYLVDEYCLFVEPILLGGGKRIFPNDGSARPLELVSATTTSTGVPICSHRPADRADG
jgi:hypothetical protein